MKSDLKIGDLVKISLSSESILRINSTSFREIYGFVERFDFRDNVIIALLTSDHKIVCHPGSVSLIFPGI